MNRQDIALVVTGLVLFFLFQGDPDVWDKLHDRVMSMENCK
jgi:hypothetical protein